MENTELIEKIATKIYRSNKRVKDGDMDTCRKMAAWFLDDDIEFANEAEAAEISRCMYKYGDFYHYDDDGKWYVSYDCSADALWKMKSFIDELKSQPATA